MLGEVNRMLVVRLLIAFVQQRWVVFEKACDLIRQAKNTGGRDVQFRPLLKQILNNVAPAHLAGRPKRGFVSVGHFKKLRLVLQHLLSFRQITVRRFHKIFDLCF